MTDPTAPEGTGPSPRDHLEAEVMVELALALGPDPLGSLRHLEVCPRCATSLEAVARVRAARPALPPDPARAAELAEAVIRELGLGPETAAPAQGATVRSSRGRWPGVAGAGLAAAVATFGTVLLLLSAAGFRTDGLLPALGAASLAALHPTVEELLARRRGS